MGLVKDAYAIQVESETGIILQTKTKLFKKKETNKNKFLEILNWKRKYGILRVLFVFRERERERDVGSWRRVQKRICDWVFISKLVFFTSWG